MILTVVFGTWMLIANPGLLKMPWMHIKLAFVVLLLVYHFVCQKILFDVKKEFLTGNQTVCAFGMK